MTTYAPASGTLGTLWLLKLDSSLGELPAARIPVVFHRADVADASELARCMGLDDPAPVLQRLQSGRHCHLARFDAQPVAYGWISFQEERIGELGLDVRLEPGEAYIWDCGTLQTYRRQRLYTALLSYMLGELHTAAYQRVWIGMDADNLPSQRGVALVGFQPVVEIVRAETGGYASRACRGASEQDAVDAHYALFGDYDATRMLLAAESDE